MVHHLTGVIRTDHRLICHGSVVTATEDIDDRASDNFKIGLAKLWQLRLVIILIDLNRSSIFCPYFPLMRFTDSFILNRIVTVTTAIEITYIHLMVGCRCGLIRSFTRRLAFY